MPQSLSLTTLPAVAMAEYVDIPQKDTGLIGSSTPQSIDDDRDLCLRDCMRGRERCSIDLMEDPDDYKENMDLMWHMVIYMENGCKDSIFGIVRGAGCTSCVRFMSLLVH